jgi:anti-anti-sigma factor
MATPSANPAQRFTFTLEDTEDGKIGYCRGQLLAEVADAFKQKVKGLLATESRLVLDMNGITRMDSSGLGAVVAVYVSAKSSKCQLQFVNLSRPVKELFGLTHLLSAFESCGSNLTKMP